MTKRKNLLNQAETINRRARQANRDLTADEVRQHDKLIDDVDKLDQQIEPLHNQREKAIDEFMSQSQGGVPYADPNTGAGFMNDNDLRDYSLTRAIHSQASGTNSPEREISQDLARRNGTEPGGILVPVKAFLNAITTTGSPGGSGLVPNEQRGFIDALRPRLSVARLGATIMSGLRGNVDIPRQVAAVSLGWKAETADLDEDNPEFGALELRPKRVGSFATFSKQLLAQSDPSVQAILANDLMAALATALDAAAINGSGSSNEPTGILNTTGVTVHPLGTDGAAPTYADLVELIKLLSDDDADEGALALLSNPSVRAKLQGTFIDAGSGLTAWDKSQALANWAISTNVPKDLTKGTGEDLSAIIHGDFSAVVIAQWGDAVDLVIDPFSQAIGGKTRIVLNAFADVGVRRAEKFAVINDAITS